VLGQLLLVRPLDVAEDPGQGLRVGQLDLLENRLQSDTDVVAQRLNIAPMAAVREDEAEVVLEPG
jgi:hypothetical protein